MLCGVIFDKQRPHVLLSSLDDITIIIACYNEESSIYETIEYINKQNYPARIIINCVDNNSSDRTKEEIMRAKVNFPKLLINYIFEEKRGKFHASNAGLSQTTTKYVISLDADTILYKDSLWTLVSTMVTVSATNLVGAIAGTIFVRNSRDNLLTKLQEWDYFVSIAAIKRAQGLFQSTLVAQGAYSIYQTSVLKDIGGWSDSIGEDIVVSWTLLEQGYKIYYDPLAVSFTNVPTKFKVFARQRARWARGMIEGFRHVKFYRCRNHYSRLLILLDYLLILIDFGMTFVWIPGLIACGRLVKSGWSTYPNFTADYYYCFCFPYCYRT
ncbi:MAG: glycosyltransferase family 2 protein [Bacteroides sp.]